MVNLLNKEISYIEHAQVLYEEFKKYVEGDEYEKMLYYVRSFVIEDLVQIVDKSLVFTGMKVNPEILNNLGLPFLETYVSAIQMYNVNTEADERS